MPLDQQNCSSEEYTRWEARFAPPDYAFGKEPNYFLKSCQKLLPRPGRVLAVADGEGRNGVWLAQQGLKVVSLDFSPTAQKKARARGRTASRADLRSGRPCLGISGADIRGGGRNIAQFSSPSDRAVKWAGMRRAPKPGGLLIMMGYTPKQLEYGTGGPKQIEKLYTRVMLQDTFGDFGDLNIVEEELEIREGTLHAGMSAVIGLTGRRP